jgi:hypothetical protein
MIQQARVIYIAHLCCVACHLLVTSSTVHPCPIYVFSSKENDTKTNITEESRLQASLVLFLAIFYHPATDTPTQFTPAPLFHEDWWMNPNIRET